LPHSLASIVNQTRKPEDVVIVLKPSGDGSEEVIRSFSTQLPIELVVQGRGNFTDAVQMAIDNARGDDILFLDDDAVAEERWVEKYENLFNLRDDPNITLYPAPFVVFSVTLFRRDVFRKMGLFNERMTQAEDRDICLRAYCRGFQSFYISTAAYDINRRQLSNVPVTIPLRQYLRGIHKKALIYAYTPSRRQKTNTNQRSCFS